MPLTRLASLRSTSMPLCDSSTTASTLSLPRKPIDQLLQLVVADAERPVRREALGMRDRHIGKRLPDHGDAVAADLLDGGRLEHAARGGIECLGVVEGGFLGQEDVLRQEFALEALEIGAQRLFAIGEFPVARSSPRCRAGWRPRPCRRPAWCWRGRCPATDRRRRAAASCPAPASLRRRSISVFRCAKPPSLPKRRGGLLEIEKGEGVGVGAVRLDAEAIEKGAADQMRRLALHRADAEIDARLAKIHRQQLRMRVGHVQDARIAEAFEIVDAALSARAREPRQHRRRARRRPQA